MNPHEAHEVPPVAPRFETVDLLRGLSILAVVLLHCWIRFSLIGVKIGTGLPKWLSVLLFRNGGNGVTVFFAISGFLITLTSVRRFGGLNGMRPRVFYRIRFARIAPPLLLTLIVLSLLHWASLHSGAFDSWHVKKAIGLPRALFAALTFHLNWLEAKTGYLPANWDVLWSLSVEEAFYLFFPLVCVALVGNHSPLRRYGRYFLPIAGVAMLFLGPWALASWITDDIGQEKSYLAGMSSIAMGCLTALAYDHLARSGRVRTKLLYAVEASGWMLIAVWVNRAPWMWLRTAKQWLWTHNLGSSVLPLATCLVIIASVCRGSRGGGVLTAPLRWFGRHSYEVYLTHEFLVILGIEAFLRWQIGRPGVWTLVVSFLTAPLGWAVATWISEPMNRRLRGAKPPQPTYIPSSRF